MFESGDACGSVRSALRPLRSVSGEGHTLKEHSGGGSLELIDSERAPESLESGQTECELLWCGSHLYFICLILKPYSATALFKLIPTSPHQKANAKREIAYLLPDSASGGVKTLKETIK